MDKPNGVDVDLPEVDGIPIPPYEPKTKVQYPLTVTDNDMKWGLILAVGLGLACATLYFVALLLQH
jgi:hypothetical protein